VGDAIMGFFGDPASRGSKEDAIACVKMAIAMQQRMRELVCSTRHDPRFPSGRKLVERDQQGFVPYRRHENPARKGLGGAPGTSSSQGGLAEGDSASATPRRASGS
jgi:hypothetical protein